MPATRRAPADRLCAAALCGLALASAGCYSSPPYGYGYQSNPGFYSSPPPGVYSPGNSYPAPVMNGPPGNFGPPSTFPPGGTIPPGGMIPPGGAFAPGGVPNGAPYPSNAQPFGQPTPADPTWRSSPSEAPSTQRYQPLPQPRGTTREQPVPTYNDPVPFTEDAAKPRPSTSSPPAGRDMFNTSPPAGRDMFTPSAPPRSTSPPASRDMFTPSPNSKEMFTPGKPRGTNPPNTFPEDDGQSPFKSGQTPTTSDSPAELVSSSRVPAEGPQLIHNDALVLTAASSESPTNAKTPPAALFGFDRDNYQWLRGTVDYDEEEETWFVIYNLAPDEHDVYQGGLTLTAEEATLAQLKNGDHVLLEGRVDQQKLDRRNAPVFHVEQARVVRR